MASSMKRRPPVSEASNWDLWSNGIVYRKLPSVEQTHGYWVRWLTRREADVYFTTLEKQPGTRHPIVATLQDTLVRRYPNSLVPNRYHAHGLIVPIEPVTAIEELVTLSANNMQAASALALVHEVNVDPIVDNVIAKNISKL